MRKLPFFLLSFAERVTALVIPRADPATADRSWESAVQNINGMNSILTLLPVLTGKVQNIKLIAGRIYPASLIIAGIGAGRVLSKLQLGVLLLSWELYRDGISEISYPHDEYVNKFAPVLHHVPTATPERHASGVIINHNPAETYMVEAWFRAQGQPSTVVLKQNNYTRVTAGFIIYLLLYAIEMYLATQNAATGTTTVFIVVQIICVCTWLSGILIVQARRGQGKPEIELNTMDSTEYRSFTLSTLGEHVSSEVFSFHLNNLQEYQLFGSDYEQPMLAVAGVLILISAVLDIMSTILIVGLTAWAYPWIGVELVIIAVKVVCCLEPMRQIEIERVIITNATTSITADPPKEMLNKRLPFRIHLAPSFSCRSVYTDFNVFYDTERGDEWRSSSAGLWIGQEYNIVDNNPKKTPTKYLAIEEKTKTLTLVDEKPLPQANQALQREFLAALKSIVESNKIPSWEFIAAVERLLEGVKTTMTPEWYVFGSNDINVALIRAKRCLFWRRYL